MLFTILAATSLAASPVPDGVYRATVEGNDYKVKVKRGDAKVVNTVTMTAIRMGRSAERRRQMIEAVKIATGCELADPYWKDNIIMGSLNCP